MKQISIASMMRKAIVFSALAIWIATLAHFGKAEAQVSEGWDVTNADSLVYTILKDMNNDSTTFTERDTLTLSISVGSGQAAFILASTFYDTTENFGSFYFAEDGKMTNLPADTLPPPMEAELLMHLFPDPPFNPNLLVWSVYDPPDSVLEADKITLQQRTDYQAVGDTIISGDTLKIFEIKSYTRLIDNDGLSNFIGPDSLRPPEIQQIVADLGQFNLFLTGTVMWNINRRATTNGQFTYVAIPHPNGTPFSIQSSWLRQEITGSLEVAK